MTCVRCGSNSHTVATCPWPTNERPAMKRIFILLAALAVSGCAGLQTDWRLQLEMEYSTPAADKPLPAPVVKP